MIRLAVAFLALTTLTINLAAQDRYFVDGKTLTLLRQNDGRGFEFVLPKTKGGAKEWLISGPWPAGEVRVTPDPEQGGTPVVFPELAGTQAWLAVPFEAGLSTVRFDTQGLFPDRLDLWRTSSFPIDRAPLLVSDQGTLTITLPPWEVAKDFTPSLRLTWSGTSSFLVKVEDEKKSKTFRFPGSAEQTVWDFYPAAWGLEPRRLIIRPTRPEQFLLHSLEPRGSSLEAAIEADPATFLTWPETAWRRPDREWFLWQGRDNVLVLITKNYEVQSAYLKRLAFFIEKQGYRGRLISDEQYKNLHGWNAHDYAPDDLARFFTLAAGQNFPLLPQEIELRNRLIAQGILIDDGPSRWKGGRGALLGISQASPPALRTFLFTHESFHGLYFTTPAFRTYVHKVWNGLSDDAKSTFRRFLAKADYDPGWEELMINEFQAYCLQQPSSWWPEFFRDKVLHRGGSEMEQEPRDDLVREYEAAAAALDREVHSLFGVEAGDVLDPIPEVAQEPASQR